MTRSYDGLNRMTRETQSIREDIARNVDYAYDKAANVLTLTHPSGMTIQTSYDALNRGDVIKRNGSQIADYDYVGPRHTSLTYEAGTNDVSLTLAYDGASGGRLTRMTYSQTGNSSLPDFSYAFDAGGNVTRKTFEHRSGDPSEDYAYDTLHRLTKTTFGHRPSTPYKGFIYDGLGNHLTQDDNGTSIAGLFNAANEQTKRGTPGSEVNVLYDKRGNLTRDDDSKVYFYDYDNKLTRVEDGSNNQITSYAYDALGRRIEKDVEGGAVTQFYWDDQQMVEETDDAVTPSVQRYCVWGLMYIDELILFNDTVDSGNDYFACRNHSFNITAALGTSGSVVERYDYNPYGKRFVLDADYSSDADGVSDLGLSIGHQGLMHDEATGLIYNRARLLHLEHGRFMQRDPLEYADGMNVYQAVRSSPDNRFDPTGLISAGKHHPNPLYLGGALKQYTPGLSDAEHRAVHQYFANQGFDFRNGNGDAARLKWKKLSAKQRWNHIKASFRQAGISGGRYKNLLNNKVKVMSGENPGVKTVRRSGGFAATGTIKTLVGGTLVTTAATFGYSMYLNSASAAAAFARKAVLCDAVQNFDSFATLGELGAPGNTRSFEYIHTDGYVYKTFVQSHNGCCKYAIASKSGWQVHPTDESAKFNCPAYVWETGRCNKRIK